MSSKGIDQYLLLDRHTGNIARFVDTPLEVGVQI
jgi:hypothetical protein